MRSTYRINRNKPETIVREQTAGFRRDSIIEQKGSVDMSYMTSDNRDILLDGIMITARYEHISEPFSIEVEHSFPYIKVHFEIEGYSDYEPKNTQSVPVRIAGGHFNFFYLPKVDGTLHYRASQRKSLEIVVTEAYLRSAFSKHFDKISLGFGEALRQQVPFVMYPECVPIPSGLLLTINDIIACSYEEEIKEVYLESKVKEVFSYLFSKLAEQKQPKSQVWLSEKERQDILNAERILQQNFNKPLTIRDLSVLSGINQNKLKKHFKIVFKAPVFTYLTQIRMEKAQVMLINKEMSVSETAYAVGYKNPQHFTTAFKKFFGYLPSDLKQK